VLESWVRVQIPYFITLGPEFLTSLRYYIVRHETVSLHGAYDVGGAQFYPGCHQLQVTGSGTTVVKSDLVSFPGAYKSNDPGVLYDQYNQKPYTVPGPKVFTC
jgi:hypothetical protein